MFYVCLFISVLAGCSLEIWAKCASLDIWDDNLIFRILFSFSLYFLVTGTSVYEGQTQIISQTGCLLNKSMIPFPYLFIQLDHVSSYHNHKIHIIVLQLIFIFNYFPPPPTHSTPPLFLYDRVRDLFWKWSPDFYKVLCLAYSFGKFIRVWFLPEHV